MRDSTHIADEKTAKHVANLMRKEEYEDREAAQKKEAAELVEFYKENYDFVQLVQCKKCGADLCLWVLDRNQVQANMVAHHMGLRRIVIGNNLLGSRKRLDGAMGYQCICENDSRLSPIERGIIEAQPWTGGTVPAIDPHLEAKIKQKIVATNFKPELIDIEEGVTETEGFVHTTLKK
jgi:hypothetical protein